jgi:hypothetical protein
MSSTKCKLLQEEKTTPTDARISQIEQQLNDPYIPDTSFLELLNELIKLRNYQSFDEWFALQDTRTMKQKDKDKQRLLLQDHNLDQLISKYLSWLKDDKILAWEIIDRKQKQRRTVFQLAPKRGNRMYAYQMKRNIQDFQNSLASEIFFNASDIEHSQETPMIKTTLTYDRRKFTRFEAWDRVSSDLNNYVSKLKHLWGCKIEIIRSYEAHKDGYPHVNLDILLVGSKAKLIFMKTRDPKKLKRGIKGVWRLVGPVTKNQMASKWSRKDVGILGFIDVMGISCVEGKDDYIPEDDTYQAKLSLTHDVKYLLKDMTKETYKGKALLQNAIMWATRKRSFSMTAKFREIYNHIALENVRLDLCKSNSKNVPETDPGDVEIVFLGIWDPLEWEVRRHHPPPDFMFFDGDVQKL